MNRIDIQTILPLMLKAVPEIRTGYARLEEDVRDVPLSEQDIEDLRRIRQDNGLVDSSHDQPGVTVVMEDLLVPFIVSLASQQKYNRRLKEIMDWIETLATSDDFGIKNLVGSGICESLVTTYEQYLAQIYPYMGNGTRVICRLLFSAYRVRESTKQLFGVE